MHEEFIKYLKGYKANQFIIREGEEDEDFFCLLKGKVGIWKGPPGDPDQLIKIGEISEKGSYFGEMSTLLNEIRTASIVAVDDVKVLKFPGEMLPNMIMKQPKLGLKLCIALANRLKGSTNKQQDIAQQRNEIRLDATNQTLYAKDHYQKLFVLLTAIQAQLQHPQLKSVVEFMSHDKLLQGKALRIDNDFFKDVPECLIDPVKQFYSDKVVS